MDYDAGTFLSVGVDSCRVLASNEFVGTCACDERQGTARPRGNSVIIYLNKRENV